MALTPIEPATRRRRRLPGRLVLLVMLGIIVLGAIPALVLPMLSHRTVVLDDFGEVPAFSLVDERGQAFSADALKGHITIVSFLFTRCDTICPVTTMKMHGLQEQTFDVGDRVKLLSLSVDPTYDTPERLAAYAEKNHADAARWRFVTGPVDRIRALVEGPFMTSMLREPDRRDGIPNIAHGGYFALVDGRGHIRGMYDSNDLTRLDRLNHDARYLARTQN